MRRNVYQVSFRIFEGNATELENVLSILENRQSLTRFNVSNRNEQGRQQIFELNRFFHNYLASAKTLIDHTRVFINENYAGLHIQQEYQTEIDRNFKDDELCRFIQDLRNYIIHRGIPDNHLKSVLHQESNEVSSVFNLDVTKLLEWGHWTSLSRSFLEKKEKNQVLSISSIITPYSNKISVLYEWLDNLLTGFHAEDIAEYEQLQREFELLKSQNGT